MQVPEVVRQQALSVGAGQWLADLPDIVETLAVEWDLRVGPAYPDATEAFVAAVEQGDGTPAVLKVPVPGTHTRAGRENLVLRLTAGEGCVTLLREDADRGAMLLERLGPSMYRLALPYEQRLPLLVEVARRVWRRAPGIDLPTGADGARELAAEIPDLWERLDRPCSERAVDHGLACAERRRVAHDDERAVLLHGDVTQWNALQANGSFRLVDPEGLLAEPEYDLGIFMREDPVELLQGDPFDRAAALARRTGLDSLAIWEWGVVERLAGGLRCIEIDLQPAGDQMVRAADAVVASGLPS